MGGHPLDNGLGSAIWSAVKFYWQQRYQRVLVLPPLLDVQYPAIEALAPLSSGMLDCSARGDWISFSSISPDCFRKSWHSGDIELPTGAAIVSCRTKFVILFWKIRINLIELVHLAECSQRR